MDALTAPLAAEVDALRDAFAALNRNDIPAVARLFDPQIVRIEPADFPGGGTYHGAEAVQAHLALQRSNWAEGACEPERFVVAGQRIIVLLHVRARLNHESAWREGRIADVFTFRGGKASEWRTFGDSRQALAWAGVASGDPG